MTLPPDADAPEEIRWEGRFITAKTRGRWEFVGRARGIKAAVILAVDEEDNVILVDQYRVPLQRRCLELPAGLVGDESDMADEDPANAAIRELEEETGYRAGIMENMGEFFSSPGMVSESFTLFRARDLVKVGEGGGVDDEDIVVHRVPLSRIGEVIADFRAKDYAMDVKMLALLGPALLR
ncbi:NUDIX hydrolase [Novosphingobium mangrovi (ex Hu et al. 2023)]|uniref:GDP-mannose pyrophosphatase n=1 Tax=Novosphingobium mangrovi (ex Hu et al. 2023) TaxID=2930094 RepID=A0ABT0A7P8_9SPHN|nr:NUDIX hydrolase [Novosphingobium mangrovi (ex Hu et al. 2023)]MCJ1959226.1 NUDIX hydrolase [Novosphingobium mangrovi (ex Hu et al. 2023)]